MTTLQWFYQRFAIPSEGQNAEPGDPVQKMSECVYACTSVALQLLGYMDTEPTDLMNLIHPQGHVGGESFDVVAAYLQAHPEKWPNLPPIRLYNPPDTLAAIDAELAAGHVLILDVYDDRNANVLDHPLTGWNGTHAVMVEAKDATVTTIWNPWAGNQQTFPNVYIKGATLGPNVGNFFVFQRDLRAQEESMRDGDLIVLKYLMQWVLGGPGNVEGATNDTFIKMYNAGTPLNYWWDNWSKSSGAWWAKLNAAGIDTSQFAKLGHDHTGTVTVK